VTYVVTAFDNFNGSANVSSSAVLTITNGTCNAATSACTSFSVGSQTVTASYKGKTAQATQIVTQAATTTVVMSTTGSPSVVGQAVIYTATVSVGAPGTGIPTGNVEFFDGLTPIGACSGSSGTSLSGSTATCTITYVEIGSHTITAQYLGDSNYSVSPVSPSIVQVVEQANTSTTVISTTGTPTVVGQSVTYNATVSVTSPGAGNPTGNIEFFDSGTPIGDCAGSSGDPLSGSTATCTVTYTSPGTHTIKAQYLGDSNFAISPVSGSISQVVNQANTTTAVTTDSPTYVSGQNIVVTAIVAPVAPGAGTPTGTIAVSDGVNVGTACTIALPTTTCTIVESAGSYTFTGVYSGDVDFLTSTGSSTAVVVGPDSSKNVVTDNASSPVAGANFTFTTTVSAVTPGSGTPVGTITWKVFDPTNNPVSCTGTTPAGGIATCSVSDALAGTYSASTFFTDTDGDFTNSASNTDTVDVGAVSAGTAGTNTVVSTDASTYVSGQKIVVTAVVTPAVSGSGTPTGSVTVSDGVNPGTACTIVLPLTTCNVRETPGTYTFSGTYGGDSTFAGSNGAAPPVDVTPDATDNVVSDDAVSPGIGSSFIFTTTVSAESPGTGTPQGTIAWSVTDPNDNPVNCTDTTLSGGIATCTISGAVAGNYSASTTFSDTDGDFTGASSNTDVVSVSSSVAPPGTITQTAPFSDTVTTTQSTTFTTQLTPTTQGGGSVTYATVLPVPGLSVSSTGVVTTVAGPLKVGVYAVSGTDKDTLGDVGTWKYTLNVTPATIIQTDPFDASVSPGSSSAFSDLLAPTSENGVSVVYTVVVTNANLSVSGAGKVTVVGGPLAVGAYTVSGTDGDSLGDAGDWTFTLNVVKGTIVQLPPFGATITSSGCIGFSVQLQVSGSIGPAVFTVSVGDPHLHASSSGKITTSGKLSDGTYTISGTDADGSGDMGTWTFTLTVGSSHAGTTSLHLYPQNPSPVVVGSKSVYVAFVHATSGTGPLTGIITFSEDGTAIPGCVGIHPVLGFAYCTVTFPDAGSVTVSAAYSNDPNFAGSSDSSIQKVVEGTTSLAITPSTPVPVGASVTYSATVSETSGSGPLTGTVSFTENGLAIPSCTNVALVGDAATCNVSFPKSGTFSIAASYANDPNFLGSSSSLSQMVTSTGNLQITTTSLAGAGAGQDNYSQILSGTGGTKPYSWSIISGILPKGLTLNASSGLISGNVSDFAQSETFTVQLSDSGALHATRQFTIDVNGRPVFTCGDSDHGFEGHYFQFQFTARGPHPSFGLVGRLPKGVSFDSDNGSISGTPESGSSGAYSFTISANNSWGSTNQSFTLNVSN
jgi:hypothetical protein